jgi:small-conductance mechanosensitive channel
MIPSFLCIHYIPVNLEKFSADAPSLSLDFWVDLLAQINRRRVMSNIRYRIEELFGENGIVIAYPQRDVIWTA